MVVYSRRYLEYLVAQRAYRQLRDAANNTLIDGAGANIKGFVRENTLRNVVHARPCNLKKQRQHLPFTPSHFSERFQPPLRA